MKFIIVDGMDIDMDKHPRSMLCGSGQECKLFTFKSNSQSASYSNMASGGGRDMPWAHGGSVFSLMAAGEELAPSVMALNGQARGKVAKKEKKKKDKDKKEKKVRSAQFLHAVFADYLPFNEL